MAQTLFKKLLPHVIAIVTFLIIAMVYCRPALEGKVLQQHDVIQWKGMNKDIENYQEKHNGQKPLWTNGMFSGMPTYQISVSGDNPISPFYVQDILTLGLPKPVSFFFLACMCFYFLALVLGANPYLSLIGGLAYAYATYNPIIIAAGHDTKMIAIAYMPAFIGAILLIYEKKYLWGAALTLLLASLFVGANHLQITYYTFIIVGFMSLAYLIKWIKEKQFKHLIYALSIAALSLIAGIAVNSVMLFTTYEYAKKSIRGGSALADSKSYVTKTGLNKDYALSYSIYKTEPLVMMFPRVYGGSSANMEIAEDKSKTIAALQQMPQDLGREFLNYLHFYWGGIDGVGTAGPPYSGAIICFLALIGFAILDNKHKWWMLAAIIVTFFLSWGKYFEGFNLAMLKYLPMYDKFRAPSMILVVPTILLCIMAVLTVQRFFNYEDKAELWKKYKKGLLITTGIFLVAIVIYFTADFTSDSDKMLLERISEIQDVKQRTAIEGPATSFLTGLKEDRQSLFTGDLLRSLLFILPVAFVLFLYIKRKANKEAVLIVTGLLAFIDIMAIDLKYLNSDNYQSQDEYETNFVPSQADIAIARDTSFYRVYDLTNNASSAFNSGAINSYFHKSIGGYHAAKLSIYQDLIEKKLYNQQSAVPIVNMLNVKYVITRNRETGDPQANPNRGNLGACWFVKDVQYEKGPAEVMNTLSNVDLKETALVEKKDKAYINFDTKEDSTASIRLIRNDNDFIEYHSNASSNRYAVFSEIFYDKGWKAYIDGKETPIVQTNYVLRGLSVPAGEHKIIFEFKPASYYTGNTIAIGASAIVWLSFIVAVVAQLKRKKKNLIA